MLSGFRDATCTTGFPTGVENRGGGGGCTSPIEGALQNLMRGAYVNTWRGELKMLSKTCCHKKCCHTCEGVHLIVKLPAISLQASKFTINELLHTYFSRILAKF